MSLPTYEAIADLMATPIHPPEERSTRSGIKKYLMRIGESRVLVTPATTPVWYRLWAQIEWARWAARSLHVELPAKLWREDQARLAAKLANAPKADTKFLIREQERALAWTRRRSRLS